ncbi:MAG: zinc ribbon-containing protein [Cellvibrionaceae bacterium]
MKPSEPMSRQSESGFWNELVDELMFLELKTARWVLSAADPTAVEMRRLQSCFELTDSIRQARETADHEQLKCEVCGYEYFARGIITVQPCHQCGHEFFSVGKAH